jgi:hypothetical protein
LSKESHTLETRQRDVIVLSKNVVEYVGKEATPVKQEIEDSVKALSERFQK